MTIIKGTTIEKQRQRLETKAEVKCMSNDGVVTKRTIDFAAVHQRHLIWIARLKV